MGSLFLFLFRNLKGYRLLVVFAIFISFVGVAVDILAALPLKYIPAKLQNPNTNPDAIWSGAVSFFDRFDPSHAAKLTPHNPHTVIGVILFSAALLVVATILDAILGYIDLFVAAYIGQNLTSRLRKELFEQIQRLSLDWHGKQKKGDLVQRVTGNISDIEKFVTDGLVDLLTGFLTILGVAAVMFYYSVPYTLLSVVIVPALAFVVFSYTLSIKAASKKAAKATAAVADVAVEDVGAITVIKAFDLVGRETDRFNQYVDKTRKAGLRAGSLQAQFTPIVTMLVGAGTAIIIGIGAYVAAGNKFSFLVTLEPKSIDIGTIILFITLLGKLFQPMKDLSKLTNVATGASAAAERIQDILDQAPEVTETKTPYTGPKQLRGEISFENVTFGYTPEKLILKGINLHISAGKRVALVGLSGGGKTTLVKLIPRFYETTGGSLKIDGRDNREYPLSVLRQNVSMVLQESVLFEGTILENLKIGRPDATIEEVIKATKQAHIHEVIMSWSDGYGTLVRNQGKNFSGGQRQRLAIARALLSDAHILVLDEPTAALDVEAEMEVMTALEELVAGRTVLMISHRLSTLGRVDEIIVLKEGLIVEQGSYKDLKNRPNGIFAELLGKQKQYDVDYAGKSVIIPRGELANLIKQKQNVVPSDLLPIRDPSPASPHAQPATKRKARVLIAVDGNITNEYELNKPEVRVGRQNSNDVCIPSGSISRLHARIYQQDHGWLIEDAQSLNGLNYQGELIDRHVLIPGDRIYLSPRVILTYQEDATPVAPAPRPYLPPAASPLPVPPPPARPPVATLPSTRRQAVIRVDGRVIVTRPLDKDSLTLGRLPNNDLPIPSPLISGQHAVLVRQGEQWLIIDKGSRNGLTYQGQRVERLILNKDDSIHLAPTVTLQLTQL